MKITIEEKIIGKDLNRNIVVDLSTNLSTSKLTLKDIIIAKVEATVNSVNNSSSKIKSNHYFSSDKEKRLNKHHLEKKEKELQEYIKSLKLDVEKETYIALEAFQKNMFFIIIDEKQYSDLDEQVILNPKSQVQFIKLTQLKGG